MRYSSAVAYSAADRFASFLALVWSCCSWSLLRSRAPRRSFRASLALWPCFVPLHLTLTNVPPPLSVCTYACLFSFVKNLLTHGASCSIRAQRGCGVCKRIWALLQIHARQCKKDRWVLFFVALRNYFCFCCRCFHFRFSFFVFLSVFKKMFN